MRTFLIAFIALLFSREMRAAEALKGQTGEACALLSSAEIERISGESVKSAKPTSQVQNEVRFSQCFYTLQTFSNSISIALTAPRISKSHSGAARELWRRWFHKDEHAAVPDSRDGDAPRGGNPEEEEAVGQATPVKGLGTEAFWVHSFVGNLYVLKGDEFIRISLGGKQTADQRLAKARALAVSALSHMP